jgi:hypothetical protein
MILPKQKTAKKSAIRKSVFFLFNSITETVPERNETNIMAKGSRQIYSNIMPRENAVAARSKGLLTIIFLSFFRPFYFPFSYDITIYIFLQFI